jgi:hypothetical protein
MVLQPRREFPPIHEELDRAVVVKDGEAQSEGGARHIGAADIEQPGQGIGIAEHRGGDALAGKAAAEALALVLGAAPRIAQILGHHRGSGGGG